MWLNYLPATLLWQMQKARRSKEAKTRFLFMESPLSETLIFY